MSDRIELNHHGRAGLYGRAAARRACAAFLAEVREGLGPHLCDETGVWTADHLPQVRGPVICRDRAMRPLRKGTDDPVATG